MNFLVCATSVFSVFLWFTRAKKITTETQRTQRLHREESIKKTGNLQLLFPVALARIRVLHNYYSSELV